MEYQMRIYEIEHGEKQQVMPGFSDEDVFNVLRKNCSQAWDAMVKTKKMLFRGIDDKREIIHAKTRINRTTATMPGPRQQIDAAFIELGFAALRTNSISTISSYGEAGNFGDVYIIVPKDGFAFTWSPVVEDFGTMTGGAYDRDDLPKLMRKYECDTVKELLVDVMRYTNKNLPAAIASGNEVSISGEYYALDADTYLRPLKAALI
jgi:hypothetical protein